MRCWPPAGMGPPSRCETARLAPRRPAGRATTRGMHAVDWNFATTWESVADALPDRDAIVQGDRRRTWREFDERAARVAAGLVAAGLEPGAKVASYLYN